MVTKEQHYEFLKQHYRHDRFEGRNGPWCENYSHVVADSTYEYLIKYGKAWIDNYSSNSGLAICYDVHLNIIKIRGLHGDALGIDK